MARVESVNDSGNSANKYSGALAEVLSASITALTAETIFTPAKAQFGSFIKVASPENDIDIFAVVFDVVTGPPDNMHKPSALGMSRDQLRLEQPHIFTLLKTHIQAAIVGYRQGSRLFQHLPPQPPEVHDFVYLAEPTEVSALAADFEFLSLLAHVGAVPTDELMAAAIRQAAAAKKASGGAETDFLIEAGRAVSQLFRSDYDRMVSIIKKIKPEAF